MSKVNELSHFLSEDCFHSVGFPFYILFRLKYNFFQDPIKAPQCKVLHIAVVDLVIL